MRHTDVPAGPLPKGLDERDARHLATVADTLCHRAYHKGQGDHTSGFWGHMGHDVLMTKVGQVICIHLIASNDYFEEREVVDLSIDDASGVWTVTFKGWMDEDVLLLYDEVVATWADHIREVCE